MRDYEIEIKELIAKAVELYYVNGVIEQADYEAKMIAILSELCDLSVNLGFSRGNYRMREEQFGRYKWHLDHIGLKEFDIFKIIGDIAKVMDNDEYYWKPKEDLKN